MSNQFIPIDRDTPLVIPVQAWLPEDHLARFMVAMVDSLDVTALEAAYSGGGSPPYPPKLRLTLLFSGQRGQNRYIISGRGGMGGSGEFGHPVSLPHRPRCFLLQEPQWPKPSIMRSTDKLPTSTRSL